MCDLDFSHVFTWVGSVRSTGSAISPRVIVMYQYLVYHTDAGIISGTRTVRVPHEIGSIRHDSPWWLPILGSWWLPIKLPCIHCLIPQAHNHVGLNQSTGIISMVNVGGSSCSGSAAAADDLGSGQQGGSSADPGVDTIELLDDADEEAGSTTRCMLLLFVFMFSHVPSFCSTCLHACTRHINALLLLHHKGDDAVCFLPCT